MIIGRSPYRITLGGGGTDLPSFYQHHGGFIFAMSIDKYINVIFNPSAVDRRVRLQYLQSEVVEHASKLRHPLAREALLLHGIEEAVEITSIGDLPARAGVGSSGSYLVALLAALRTYERRPATPQDLAEEACYIEMERLHEPVGKQDQYMAAFGGLRILEIARNGTVATSTIDLPPGSLHEFVANTHVYYTGVERRASEILQSQNQAAQRKDAANHLEVMDSLKRIRDLGIEIVDAVQAEDFDRFGRLLDVHWQAKRRMSDKISLSSVDALYDQVKAEFGVLGGKIIGAGGGGFLMLYCPAAHRRLSDFMERHGMPRLHYALEFQGAKIVADLRSSHEMNVNHRSTACMPSLQAEPASSAVTS